MSWGEEELMGINLGDKRLNDRAISLVETLGSMSDASIPAKTKDHAEMTAAYRFIDNDKVDDQKILAAQRSMTLERMRNESDVLCVEDTTQIDYTTHRATPGLGPLYQSFQRGMFLHPMLAVSSDGVCLGILEAKMYARDPEAPKKSAKERAKLPIELKESYRWLEGYRHMNALAKVCSQRLIYVADRESDVKELLAEAQGQPGLLLIRVHHDRKLDEEYENDYYMLDVVRESPVKGTITFDIKARPGRTARTVVQTLKAKDVTLPPLPGQDDPIRVTVVIAEEVNPPAGEDPISWTLITTLPAKTEEDIIFIVNYYRHRWTIEEFFKVLKSGCKIECLQLETVKRLKVAVSMYMIVAAHILRMTKIGREIPDTPCDAVLEDEEWKLVYAYHKGTAPPKTPPRLMDIIVMIAKMGGFTGRKAGVFPGTKTLWVGLGKIRAYLEIDRQLKEHGVNPFP